MPIASLGMYDQPFADIANDQLWTALKVAISQIDPDIPLPAALNRSMPLAEQWQDKDLLLSHTCGYPYITEYRQHLQLVATPVYAHNGCTGAYYSSVILTASGSSMQLDDYRNTRLAANSPTSLSGFITLEKTLQSGNMARPFFAECSFCGSHMEAIRRVANGESDLCCIDAVSWALMAGFDPQLCNKLQVIKQTTSFPALPLVTSKHTPATYVQTLRQALQQTLAMDSAREALTALGIVGFEYLPESEYESILEKYQHVKQHPIAENLT